MYKCTTGVSAALATCLLAACAAPGGAVRETPAPPPGPEYHAMMAAIAADRGVTASAAEEFVKTAEQTDDPGASQRATEYAFEYGFDALALRAARRWVQLAPADESCRLYLTRLLVRRNDVAGAAAEAAAALGPADGRDEADYQFLAGELGEEGNLDGVTRVWTRLAGWSPPSPALQAALGSAALRSDDAELALAAARAALVPGETHPSDDEANAVIGRALLAEGKTEEALAHAAAVQAADPSLAHGLEQAGLLALAERYEDALALLDALRASYGDEPELRRLHALVSLSSGDLKAAWDQFGTLVSNEEFGDEGYYRLAEIALRQEQLAEALQLFTRITSGPYFLLARDALAQVAEARGDPQTALQILSALAEREPQYAFRVARRRAAILQKAGDNEQALAVLDEVVRYQPDDADLLLSRGALLEQMGRLDPALDDMRAAVRLFPDNSQTLNALGYTLANRTRHQAEAYALIRRAFERDPTSAPIIDSYGWVLFKQGRLAEARSYLELAHARFPDPEVAAHLGEVMWRQGEHEAARSLWQDALDKAPSSKPLQDTMARFIK